MATERVGVYRKYHGPVPTNNSGQRLPQSEWPGKRAFQLGGALVRSRRQPVQQELQDQKGG